MLTVQRHTNSALTGIFPVLKTSVSYLSCLGVGGHGGSGIHADIESKNQEIIQRVSNYATAKHNPQIGLLPEAPGPYYSQSSVRDSYDIGEGEAGDPLIPGYMSDTSGPSARGMGTHPSQPSRRGTRGSGQSSQRSYNPTVQQVHVPKCAVCTIL